MSDDLTGELDILMKKQFHVNFYLNFDENCEPGVEFIKKCFVTLR
jgi:hypothetical protein